MSDKSYIKMWSHNGGAGQIPRRLIIHSLGEFIDTGERGYLAPEYLDKVDGTSAHYFVTPSGVVIRQRGDHQIAYHALGNNTATLGVEFMVPGAHNYATFLERIKTPYLTEPQWEAGIELCRRLRAQHNFEAIQRHSDIDPQRKYDPGEGFPWQKFLEAVQ